MRAHCQALDCYFKLHSRCKMQSGKTFVFSSQDLLLQNANVIRFPALTSIPGLREKYASD
ncbi:MAG: hypothetical protein A3F74_05685 [Betaproteobacteria bacterium RIFCSPLOWO2_12_FULL_62_58]|nr:MAG: hypothetical protein A3I62_00040 [Betaproteobacteria bacterium RIFCSPLOWO2_02_FULL_62_79]OGA46513.1 MAG: hypothetical protein A3F74_05685 [Betaproteobacteria bacterium RIFCSPLOWO2_12_FULL_62_58]